MFEKNQNCRSYFNVPFNKTGFLNFFEKNFSFFFKAKCIVNKAKINEEQEAATIRELQKEIEQLKMTKTMGIEKAMIEKAEIEAEIEKLKQTQENSQKLRLLIIIKFVLKIYLGSFHKYLNSFLFSDNNCSVSFWLLFRKMRNSNGQKS